MVSVNSSAFVEGLLIGFSLIVAIGPQNIFVLKQGLKKEGQFITASISSIGDTFLILMGVGGLGSLLTSLESFHRLTLWGGALFLIYFGVKSILEAREKEIEIAGDTSGPFSKKKIVLEALAFSLLNPHVYIDTVLMIGTLAANYDTSARVYFAAGTILASWIWFFALSYGASLFAPVFQNKRLAQLIYFAIAILMFVLAYRLVSPELRLV